MRARAKMATLIQQDLAALGMQVTVVTLDFPALIERLMHTQDYEACLLGLENVDPEPNAMMNIWLSSSPNHQWNPSEKTPATAWEAEIDRLMNQQAATAMDAERKKAIDRVQQIVADEAAVHLPRLSQCAGCRVTEAAGCAAGGTGTATDVECRAASSAGGAMNEEASAARCLFLQAIPGRSRCRRFVSSYSRARFSAWSGSSGAGKSTLVLSLLGLLPWRGGRVTGEVLLRGENLLTLSEKATAQPSRQRDRADPAEPDDRAECGHQPAESFRGGLEGTSEAPTRTTRWRQSPRADGRGAVTLRCGISAPPVPRDQCRAGAACTDCACVAASASSHRRRRADQRARSGNAVADRRLTAEPESQARNDASLYLARPDVSNPALRSRRRSP